MTSRIEHHETPPPLSLPNRAPAVVNLPGVLFVLCFRHNGDPMTTFFLADHHQSLANQTLQPFILYQTTASLNLKGVAILGERSRVGSLAGVRRWRGQSLSSGMNVAIAPVEKDAEKNGAE